MHCSYSTAQSTDTVLPSAVLTTAYNINIIKTLLLTHSTPAVQRLEPRPKKKSDKKNSVKIGLNAHKTYALRCPEMEEMCTANKLDSVCI